MKRKQKNQRWILLTGLFVLLLAAIGGTVWFLQGSKERQAKETADGYIAALDQGDYETLLTFFNETSMEEHGFTAEEVQAKYQAIFPAIHSSDQKVTNVQLEKNETGYQLNYQLSMMTFLGELEDLDYQTTVDLSAEHPTIDWSPALIFPGMTGKDKIRINEDPANRGDIVDRNNQPLATNREYQQLGLNPSLLGEGTEREEKLKKISDFFSIDIEQLENRLEPSWAEGDVFVPVKILYDTEEVTPLDQLPEGVVIGKESKRYYPLKEAGAHLIGYVSQVTKEDMEKDPGLSEHDLIGKSGLEATFDQQLRGEAGGSIVITEEDGTEKEILLERKRKDPEILKLTIDREAQRTAFDGLDDKPGSTVIMEPQTGDLLAVVSSPAYDPNKMMLGMTQEEYDSYANDEELPFMARFTNRYAPGSTFKVITAAIGIDAGTIDPEEEFAISGLKWQKDQSWGAYEVTRVKEASPINLEKALVYSDNIYFAQQTLALGEDKFREGLSKFIFGEELSLPLHMESASISNDEQFSSEILLADTGYGQGQLLISPIQQAAIYSVFMNEGDLVYPRLTIDEETETKENVISASAAERIINDLIHTVSDEDGYVHALYSPEFVLSAKTGTAEIKEEQDTTGIENSFLLYFDAEDQQFLGITMVENSQENETAVSHSEEIVDYLEKN